MIRNYLNAWYTHSLLLKAGWYSDLEKPLAHPYPWSRLDWGRLSVYLQSSEWEDLCTLKGAYEGRWLNVALPLHEVWEVSRLGRQMVPAWVKRSQELHEDSTSTWSLGEKIRQMGGYFRAGESLYRRNNPNEQFEIGVDTVTFTNVRAAYRLPREQAAKLLEHIPSVREKFISVAKEVGQVTPSETHLRNVQNLLGSIRRYG